MHLAFITDGIFPHAVGGIQRYSRLLLEALGREPGLEITVVHPHKGIRIFKSFDQIREVTVRDIDVNRNYLRECYHYSKRTFAAIEPLQPDLVYAQGISIWYRINDLKDKLIVNPHGLEPFQITQFKDRLITLPFRFLLRNIFRKAAYVVTEGGHLTKILSRIVPPEKIVFFPNAVNLPEASDRDRQEGEPLNILFVARFAKNKGIHILLDCVRELNAAGDQFQFNLAGKGPLFEYYRSKFAFPNVNFLGFVPDEDLFDLYKTNDLFIFPTLFEGMPTVILEAMSYALPVIGTDTGAIPELVDDTNGVLIEPADVAALRDAILHIGRLDVEQRKELGRRSRQKVAEHFTWEKVAARHMELFRKMLAGSQLPEDSE